jgi:hypothetical protein
MTAGPVKAPNNEEDGKAEGVVVMISPKHLPIHALIDP